MPELITDEAAVKAHQEMNQTSSIKMYSGECEPDNDVGLTQIATRKILNYNQDMIKFINNAGSTTKSTEVHTTFTKPKEIFITNKD